MTLIYSEFISTKDIIVIMLKKIIVFTILASVLSACVTGPEGFLKRSANNKLFDRKGFQGGKRSPLYNKKYIAQAKKNIINNELEDDADFDNDDLSEDENVSRENMELYQAMIKEDLARDQNQRNKLRKDRVGSKAYPSIAKAHNKLDQNTDAANLELREELEHIKSMLNDTKRDLASYKCPTAKELEKANLRTLKAQKSEKANDAGQNSTIIEPVKSI